MLRRFMAVFAAVVVVAALGFASVASAQRNPFQKWSYGPYGSCHVGSLYGYKEYYWGRYDGRCVLQ